MLYILQGQDSYSVSRELESIKKSLGDDDMLKMNTSSLDGKEVTARELIDICSAVPFLSSARLVVVEGMLSRHEETTGYKGRKKKQGGSKKDIQEWQELVDFIPVMPATTVLVLVEGKLSEKNRLFSLLRTVAQVKSFPQLSERSLAGWVHNRIRESGTTISNEAVELLVQLIGPDLWSMSSEIDKIVTFKKGEPITEKDVQSLTCYARETNIFNLVDAVISGQAGRAELMLDNMLGHGAAPALILTMITRQFRLILMARELHGKEGRQQIMQKMGIRSDYVYDMLIKQAGLFSMEQLRWAYESILDTDIAIKTGRYHEDLAIGMLVSSLCRRA